MDQGRSGGSATRILATPTQRCAALDNSAHRSTTASHSRLSRSAPADELYGGGRRLAPALDATGRRDALYHSAGGAQSPAVLLHEAGGHSDRPAGVRAQAASDAEIDRDFPQSSGVTHEPVRGT